MKLHIERSDDCVEDEIVIRCREVNASILAIKAHIQDFALPKLIFYQGNQAFYLRREDIFFFETEGDQVYAHTHNDSFLVRHRLYELEAMLSHPFMRIAKGTIVNTTHIYAIYRNFTASSKIQFSGTHKHVYVSRHYHKALKEKMQERT